MDNNRKAIHSTLIYSSIFQFPLTKEEVWRFAISKKPLKKDTFLYALENESFVASQRGYYFLKGNQQLVNRRISYIPFAKKKFSLAKNVSRILQYIPSVLFIGITGSLAMENTMEDDDIDLFVITQNNSLWFTRVCILLILELFGKRRKKNMEYVRNKVCVNLLIELSHMQVPHSSQNLYTAHEVAQVKPLYNKNHTFEKFLLANNWIEPYIPNAFPAQNSSFDLAQRLSFIENHRTHASESKTRTNDPLFEQIKESPRRDLFFSRIFSLLNFLAKKLQLWYMTDRDSSAIISDAVLAFYTGEMQKKVLREYEEALKKNKISNS